MNWRKVKEIVNGMTEEQLRSAALVWLGGDYGFPMSISIEPACDVHSEGHTFGMNHPLIVPHDRIEDIAKSCIDSMNSKLQDAAPFFRDSTDEADAEHRRANSR